MLKRLYIDNYKCFRNFTFEPAQLQLIVGANGSGKSAMAEVLWGIRALVVERMPVHKAFDPFSVTRMSSESRQVFTLHLTIEEHRYFYELIIDSNVVVEESVIRDQTENLMHFGAGRLTYPGGPLRLDAEYSALAALAADAGQGTTAVKNWLQGLTVTHLVPNVRGVAAADQKAEVLLPDGSNFAAWVWNHAESDAAAANRWISSLREIVPGLSTIEIFHTGIASPAVLLVPRFEGSALEHRQDSGVSSNTLLNLSDGQRALVMLYALLHFNVGPGRMLILDEPENFLALSEIEPWLWEFIDKVEDSGGQAILISHHPELVDRLAQTNGILFQRKDGGPVQAKHFRDVAFSTLQPSEVLARGWENA